MNELIEFISEHGQSEQMRMLCILGGSVCLIAFAFWYGTRMGLSNKKILCILLIAYPCMLALLEMTYEVARCAAKYHLFGIDTAWQSGVKIFVFLPMMSRILSKALKLPFTLMSDLLAVIRLTEYPLSTLGCIFAGCCTGYPWEGGLYNPYSGTYDFPTQPLNALIMCVIVVFLLARARKRNYVPDGKQLPIMLILMGTTRFATEFLMANEKIFWGISVVALHGVAMSVIGLTLLRRNKTTARNEPDS